MGIIEHEEIAGAHDCNGYIYCFNCMGNVSDYEEEDLILAREVEDAERTYWCDSCKEAL